MGLRFFHLSCLRALASGRTRAAVNLPGGMSVRREEEHLAVKKEPTSERAV